MIAAIPESFPMMPMVGITPEGKAARQIWHRAAGRARVPNRH
jgi:hypothetical protein